MLSISNADAKEQSTLEAYPDEPNSLTEMNINFVHMRQIRTIWNGIKPDTALTLKCRVENTMKFFKDLHYDSFT